MFVYCENNPVFFADSSGTRAVPALRSEMSAGKKADNKVSPSTNTNNSRTSFAVMTGFNFNIFGYGFQFTLNFVSTKENLGLQYSYYYSEDSELSKKATQCSE